MNKSDNTTQYFPQKMRLTSLILQGRNPRETRDGSGKSALGPSNPLWLPHIFQWLLTYIGNKTDKTCTAQEKKAKFLFDKTKPRQYTVFSCYPLLFCNRQILNNVKKRPFLKIKNFVFFYFFFFILSKTNIIKQTESNKQNQKKYKKST